MTRALGLPIALLVCSLVASSAAAERYAVVIGNNRGEETDELLRWAERDASRTRALLVGLGDVQAENALLLLGEPADAVRDALSSLRDRIAAQRDENATVFVYYSGHGDARSLHLGATPLALSELERQLAQTGAKTLVTIVDSCRDQPIRRKGAAHVAPFDVRLSHGKGPIGRVTISASARDELAQESDQLRSSFFTHHLLSGMRGAADRDGDRQVSLNELYRYAYHHTLATSHARLASVQHPQLEVALEGEGELVITQLSRADAVLVLDEETAGDCLIIDHESGQVVTQLYKARGVATRVALPAGHFAVQLRGEDVLSSANVGLEWGGTTTLREQDLRRERVQNSLRKGSFLQPSRFGASVDARVARPMAAASPLLGLAMRGLLDRRGLRALVDVGVSFGQGENMLQSRRYREMRFGAAFGPRWSFGPLGVFTGAGAGLLWIRERAERLADDGASSLLGVPRETRADALGGYFGAQFALELALSHGLLLGLYGDVPLTAVRVDQQLRVRLTPSIGLGTGARF